jgi:hypothetical protein
MTPADSAKVFTEFAELRGTTLKGATPAQGIEAMICFFKDVRPQSPVVEDSGDMLLYQWGLYDWGQGPSFQLNITRQFIEVIEEEEVMSQLGLTFHFAPSDEIKAFGNKNQWCETKSALNEFATFIQQSAPYVALKDSAAKRIEVKWSPV